MNELICPVCGDYLSKTVEWGRGKLNIEIFCEMCGEFDMLITINLSRSEFKKLKKNDKLERKAVIKVLEYGELI